jgi:hypothetical protein
LCCEALFVVDGGKRSVKHTPPGFGFWAEAI